MCVCVCFMVNEDGLLGGLVDKFGGVQEHTRADLFVTR